MEIEYQRNLKNSYMVLIEDEQRLNLDGQLAEKMMTKNRIRGILDYVSMEYRGQMTFWYKITGTTSFSDWLKVHPLDHVLLQHLFSGLLLLQEELPRYYLKDEHIVLKADQIFVDGSGRQFQFCYEPMWNQALSLSLSQLLEELLPLIDHEDKEAVRLGYGAYECTRQENGSLWDFLLQNQEKADIRVQSIQPEEVVQAEKKETDNLVLEEKDTPENGSVQTFLQSAAVRVRGWMKRNKKEEMTQVFHFEPEEEVTEKTEHPTVYLGGEQTAQGRLLYQGTQGQNSFYIDKESFLIGGNQKADGVLSASGISRNHARITKEADRYCLTDLNSRNGTYLNGKLLDYKKKCELHPGDRICFATQEYVFY